MCAEDHTLAKGGGCKRKVEKLHNEKFIDS